MQVLNYPDSMERDVDQRPRPPPEGFELQALSLRDRLRSGRDRGQMDAPDRPRSLPRARPLRRIPQRWRGDPHEHPRRPPPPARTGRPRRAKARPPAQIPLLVPADEERTPPGARPRGSPRLEPAPDPRNQSGVRVGVASALTASTGPSERHPL